MNKLKLKSKSSTKDKDNYKRYSLVKRSEK